MVVFLSLECDQFVENGSKPLLNLLQYRLEAFSTNITSWWSLNLEPIERLTSFIGQLKRTV